MEKAEGVKALYLLRYISNPSRACGTVLPLVGRAPSQGILSYWPGGSQPWSELCDWADQAACAIHPVLRSPQDIRHDLAPSRRIPTHGRESVTCDLPFVRIAACKIHSLRPVLGEQHELVPTQTGQAPPLPSTLFSTSATLSKVHSNAWPKASLVSLRPFTSTIRMLKGYSPSSQLCSKSASAGCTGQ